MRGASFLLAGAFLCGCSSTTFAEPRVEVSPYLAKYQVRGNTKMQSQPVASGPVQDNSAQSMAQFGQERHDDDIGLRVDIGDGFAGLRLDYYMMDMYSTRYGTLDADWGQIDSGDLATMTVQMDELRIGYLEPVWSGATEWREQPLKVRVAVGGVLAHRAMDMRASSEDNLRQQHIKPKGDNVYPAVRIRAEWRDFAVDADYAISPRLTLGGDFTDTLQDFELRFTYSIPLRDVALFAAYRYSTLPSSGTSEGLAYENDLVLDGFQFGLRVVF